MGWVLDSSLAEMFKYSGSRPLNQSLQHCGSVLELDGEEGATGGLPGSCIQELVTHSLGAWVLSQAFILLHKLTPALSFPTLSLSLGTQHRAQHLVGLKVDLGRSFLEQDREIIPLPL